MKTKPITAAFLLTGLMATAAVAQIQPSPPVAQPPLSSTGAGAAGPSFLTQNTLGVVRASDLIGRDVMGPNNEDVGEVEDILLDPTGQVAAFVIELDGAFGLGDREVAVPLSAVRVNPIDTTATTGTIPGAGLPASTPEGQEVRNENRISRILALDRIMLTIPVDQLRSAPAFDDDD